eukprot:SAG31_NODE_4079_length_3608_cov_2.597436_2_plen_99_part_00
MICVPAKITGNIVQAVHDLGNLSAAEKEAGQEILSKYFVPLKNASWEGIEPNECATIEPYPNETWMPYEELCIVFAIRFAELYGKAIKGEQVGTISTN